MSRKFLTVAMATALVAGSFTPAVAHAFSSGSSASSAIMEDPNAPGTRNNPHALKTTIRDGSWEITLNSVDLRADQRVLEANMFNDPAPAGYSYVLANVPAKYIGKDPEGRSPIGVGIDFVTKGGNTISSTDNFAVAPDSFNYFTTLYSGGTITGNQVFLVPSEERVYGTIAITPGFWAKKSFYRVF